MSLLVIMCLQIMDYICTNAQAHRIQLEYNCMNEFSHNYHSFQFWIVFTRIAAKMCETLASFLFWFMDMVCMRINNKNKMYLCYEAFFSEVKKNLKFCKYFKPDWNWFEKFSIDCIQLEWLPVFIYTYTHIYINEHNNEQPLSALISSTPSFIKFPVQTELRANLLIIKLLSHLILFFFFLLFHLHFDFSM